LHVQRKPGFDRKATSLKKVDIRPGVSVLAVLRYLNYTPWFALAEFVDNAVQSFMQHSWSKLKGRIASSK